MIQTSERKAWQALWTGADTFATILLQLFIDQYGMAAEDEDEKTSPVDWDPQTICLHIEEDFDVTLPAANFDRLMVALAMCKSDSFYKSLADFIPFCNILSGDTFDPRVWDPADAGEVAWGITEGLLIWPPDDDDMNPFSPEITAYIGAALDAEGIIRPPDVLRIATDRQSPAALPDTYTDDPVMFAAISGFEDQKTDGINAAVRENLAKLAEQLDGLNLRIGDARGAARRLFADFRQSATT